MISSTCVCSVTKLCLILCNPMDCSMPGFPVLHCLPEYAQIHVHWVGDAIQPSAALFSFCLQSFTASGPFPVSWFFASGDQSTGASASASVLPMNIRIDWFDLLDVHGTLKSLLQQHSSKTSVLPMNIQDWFPLGLTSLISLLSKGLSRVFSTTVWKHQFFGSQPCLQPNSHTDTWLLEKP